MRLAVTGGRDYWDVDTIFLVLDTWHERRPITMLIHGACPTGLDHVADIWAASRRVPCTPEPAAWSEHGKSAGPRRNQLIWDKHSPDALLSFPGGRGTADMIRCGHRACKPVYGVSLMQHKIFKIPADQQEHTRYA
jgi:YspA, cpYpsA-related SLOG family